MSYLSSDQVNSSIISDISDDSELTNSQKKLNLSKIFSILGSGGLISISFIDPASISGTTYIAVNHGYKSFWLILLFHILVYFYYEAIITLTAVTRMNLPEHLKLGSNKFLRIFFWLITEIILILLDMQNMIGASFVLSYFFGMSFKISLLVTFVLVMIVVFFHDLQHRFIQFFVVMCFFISFCCFSAVYCIGGARLGELPKAFIPRFGEGQLHDGIVLFGTLATPTNLILHSIIIGINSNEKRYLISTKKQLRIYRLELFFVLLLSFWANLCVYQTFSQFHQELKDEFGILKASDILREKQGVASQMIFLLALYANGLASTSSSTITGRFSMLGFLDLSFNKTARNIITRLIALLPSVLVVFLANIDKATKFVNIIVTTLLPIFLIPFCKLISCKELMKSHKYNLLQISLFWAGTLAVVISSLVEIYLMFHSGAIATVAIGVSGCLLYLSLLIFLARYDFKFRLRDSFFIKTTKDLNF